MAVTNYDRDAAVEYALTFSDTIKGDENYNSDGFISCITNEGKIEDCANFVSQCLFYGGMPMDMRTSSGWYYKYPYSKRSVSRPSNWTAANYLKAFLLQRGHGYIVNSVSSLTDGDLVFSKDSKTSDHCHHVTIINHIENGKIYVCGHTADQSNSECGAEFPLYFHLKDEFTLTDDDRLCAGYYVSGDFATARAGYGKETLRLGTIDDKAIPNLQSRLQFLGFYSGGIHNKFDTPTEEAVRRYQEYYSEYVRKIAVDGVVGLNTKMALYHPIVD